jgi:alpha-amylase
MMFADIDYHHNECQDDVKNWGVWITKKLGLKGFRMDAVQHFSERFTSDWVKNIRKECGDVFVVGEYWVGDAQTLLGWLEKMGREFSLFDAPLLYNFNRISTTEKSDLRAVFDGSLVKSEPYNAVVCITFLLIN